MRFVKINLLFVLLTVTVISNAQFGFDWIKTYQPYFKFPIANSGIYTIDSTTLANSGLSLSGVHPKRFQLFVNGTEVPIFIRGQADGVFNSTDVIEFYAKPNDGKMDSMLYTPASAQLLDFKSLYSDTSYYFLTVLPDTSVRNGLRMIETSDVNFGLYTPQDYVLSEVRSVPFEEYYQGQDYAGIASEVRYYLSAYDLGEGWASYRVGAGTQRIFSLQTPAKSAASFTPTFAAKVLGTSNAATTSNVNHHIQLWVGGDNNGYVQLADRTYRGYDVVNLSGTVNVNQIGNNTTDFSLRVINDLGVAADFNSLAFVTLTYAREPQLLNTTQLLASVNHHKGGLKSRLQFVNYGNGLQQNPVLYDLTLNQRIVTTYSSGVVNGLITNDGVPHAIFLTDSLNRIPVSKLQPIVFNIPDPGENYEFLIVTSDNLLPAATSYAQYRSSRFKVLTVTTQQLYNTYTFGQVHPLAIRKFASHIIQNSNIAPEYLLLAGRGYQNNLTRNNGLYYQQNLVPAIGVPSSDHLFTSGITNNGVYPQIATGRIPAATNEELNNYLAKLIDYETAPDSILPWRKEVLHVTGGTGEAEQISFQNQFKSNEQTIEGAYVGANVTTFNKNSLSSQQANLRERILAVQNSGVSMVSFYGHASLTVLDMDIGNIFELNNPRKYPLYYFSGCNVGNANVEDPGNSGDVYAKNYLCFPNKGAIGWLAHTNFSYTNQLNTLLNSFYQRYTVTQYGVPIGKLIQSIAANFPGTDEVSKSHITQWLYQGDPAVVIYQPSKPDYAIQNSDLFVFPQNATVQDDSFAVAIIARNLAKATSDSFSFTLTRTLPDGRRFTYGPFIKSPLFYKDTFFVWVPGKDNQMVGNNVFEVTLNPLNTVSEITAQNNAATFTYFLPGQGLQLIEPYPYQVVPNDTVMLLAQSNNVFAAQNEFIFELDTTPLFNSSWLKTSGIVSAPNLATWKVALQQSEDTVAYFWRARLNVPLAEGGYWVTESFSHVSSGRLGWSQVAPKQFKTNGTTDLVWDSTQNTFNFLDFSALLTVKIGRWVHGGLGVLYPEPLNPGVFNCIGSGGVVCILFNPVTLQPFVNPRFPINCSFPSSFGHKYYTFDTKTLIGQQEFQRFIDSVPDGYVVASYSYYNVGSDTWTPQTRAAFTKIGSTKTAAIQNFYSAFAMIGRKGSTPGTIAEDTIFNNLYNAPNPADTANLVVATSVLQGFQKSGELMSSLIGPSTSWKTVSIATRSREPMSTDILKIQLWGNKGFGEDTLLKEWNGPNEYTITDVPFQTYPFVRLKLLMTDSIARTPSQLVQWSVLYDAAPEGTLAPTIKNVFYKPKLDQGDSVRFQIAFQNVSTQPMDSVPVRIELFGSDRTLQYSQLQKFAPLAPQQFFIIGDTLATTTLSGKCQMVVTVNPNRMIAERNLVNNIYTQAIEVATDQSNPLMDVTFDGYRIMNGDYVSPSPTIRISSTDANPFKLQIDTGTFAVWLKKPTDANYTQIPIQSSEMQFIPASTSQNKAELRYQPQALADGLYKFKVLSKDASGNAAGTNGYEVEFNVVNESSITHFYPYPNPCTTQMRFVFTVTGSQPPDGLLVRIMTITGKVVREVRQDEFGPIKIGHNVSTFVWDGTDNFGDRLANGVYLYQVQTQLNGQSIKHKETVKDNYFIQNTGKIYLMR
ncbi:MAG: C25 family cysteine peptidase [Bacteroidia bacterium]|jgi:hypothetical protein|nr:C25 family cysteine peptidase [Bacteroidia bacterium]